jgi:hypothetical protein
MYSKTSITLFFIGQGVPAQQATDSPMDMDFTTPAYFFQMSSCEVAEGRLARFDCRVVAYPKPEIVWYVELSNILSPTIKTIGRANVLTMASHFGLLLHASRYLQIN